MSVFAILSEQPRSELRAAIEDVFPSGYYHWSDTVSFVRADGPAASIAKRLGIKSRNEDGEIVGPFDSAVVMRVSPSYFGWSKATLWEWLKGAFEADN
jgi:hypothetical protein